MHPDIQKLVEAGKLRNDAGLKLSALEPGVFVQSRNADRWLALIDQQRTPLDRLPAFGARDVTATPVSLEDLFVALGRD